MKKRGFGSHRYNGVGGKIDPGETIEQALIRECQEEINVTPTHFWKVAKHDFIQPTGNQRWRMIVHVYISDAWDGDPIETEEMAPEWFNLADIPYSNMWADDEFWLPQVLDGKKIHGVFSFVENEALLTHNVVEVSMVDNS